jgi:hypothetical protein
MAHAADLANSGFPHTTTSVIGTVKLDRSPPEVVLFADERGAEGHEDFSNGQDPVDVTAQASDEFAGIQQMGLERIGVGPIGASVNTCDQASECPSDDQADFAIDVTGLSSGRHVFRTTAVDAAGNVGRSSDYAVYVDRAGPSAPSGLAAFVRPGENVATVYWDPSSDPPLADGSQGSGVEVYEYRYSTPSQAWTDWRQLEGTSFEVGDVGPGTRVSVQVKARDGVGNIGALLDASTDIVLQADAIDVEVEDSEPSTPQVAATIGSSVVCRVRAETPGQVTRLLDEFHGESQIAVRAKTISFCLPRNPEDPVDRANALTATVYTKLCLRVADPNLGPSPSTLKCTRTESKTATTPASPLTLQATELCRPGKRL